jgi:hypothetical protein
MLHHNQNNRGFMAMVAVLLLSFGAVAFSLTLSLVPLFMLMLSGLENCGSKLV